MNQSINDLNDLRSRRERSLRPGCFVCFILKNGIEKAVFLPSGLLLGKEHHEHASTPVLPTPPAAALSSTGTSSAHAKTGSKDSSTQTDKSTELFWPNMASLPNRGRLSATPSNSPVLKHPATKGTAEKLGKRFPPPFTLWGNRRALRPERGSLLSSRAGIRGPHQLSLYGMLVCFFNDYAYPNAFRPRGLLWE